MTAASRRPAAGRAARGASARGVEIVVGRDGTRAGLRHDIVQQVALAVLRAERVRNALVSVTFVSDAAMRRLNARHLGRHAATDVIAFGMREASGRVVGDVYIAPGAARRAAAQHGITIREELVRLVVHGVLHVLGHDHPAGAGRERSAMWRRQESLVGRAMRRVVA